MTEPAPLREPFFLRGRKSVVQRAVIMSLVLGGLAAIASWIVAGMVVALGPGESSLAISTTWGLAAAILIHAPIQYWNGRSWRRLTLVAVPISAIALYLALQIANHGLPGTRGRTFNLIFAYTVLLIINGAPLVRSLPLHMIAYLVSILGGIIPAVTVLSINDPGQIPIPGMPEIVKVVLVLAAVFGGLLGAVAIPWGLPFWWPPENDEPTLAPNPELLPDLLNR